jgi:hypothetical protein
MKNTVFSYGLNAYFWTNIKMFIASIHLLERKDDIFVFSDQPIIRVDIMGVVISNQSKSFGNEFTSDLVLMLVDDGTGFISCVHFQNDDYHESAPNLGKYYL